MVPPLSIYLVSALFFIFELPRVFIRGGLSSTDECLDIFYVLVGVLDVFLLVLVVVVLLVVELVAVGALLAVVTGM